MTEGKKTVSFEIAAQLSETRNYHRGTNEPEGHEARSLIHQTPYSSPSATGRLLAASIKASGNCAN